MLNTCLYRRKKHTCDREGDDTPMHMREIDQAERGRLAEVTPSDVVGALHSVASGRVFDLDPGRYVGRASEIPADHVSHAARDAALPRRAAAGVLERG
jgi:hypothetical protein